MTEKHDNNENLEDVFDKATKEGASSKDVQKEIVKKQKDRKIAPYLIAAAVLVLLGGGVAFLYPHFTPNGGGEKTPTEQTSGPKGSDESSDKDLTDEEARKEIDDELAKADEENKTPIRIEDWTKVPFETQKKNGAEALYASAVQSAQASTFTNFSGMLPSEKDGYTDDMSKALNEDGTPNEWYSFQTQENLNYSFSTFTQRLLNPAFGGWGSLTYGVPGGVEESFPNGSFTDMFTEAWWAANIQENDHSKLPIYADWNGDNWGGLKLDGKSNGIWFGHITEMSVTGEALEDGSGMEVIVDSDVSLSAYLEDGSKETRTGTLHLKFTPNLESTDPTTRHLLSEASLTVNQ